MSENIISDTILRFKSQEIISVSKRKEILKKLKVCIKSNENNLLNALFQDLGKSQAEAYMSEFMCVYSEIDFMLKNIDKWNKTKKVKACPVTFFSENLLYTEPYGVVLIISAWNYPVSLSLIPLIDAIAAGNCVILKPSEQSVYTSELLEKILNDVSDNIFVLNKDTPYKTIWAEKYDYIMFTGSSDKGKLVMSEAAKNLTPVTLELGGKSPCIVDSTAKLEIAAKRIIRGKLMNAGQTCIAPDYVLAHSSILNRLVDLLKAEIEKQYSDALNNPLYPKIINEKHFDRLVSILNSEKNVIGGKYNRETLKIEPSIIKNADENSPSMKDEIFGPILPVIGYSDENFLINKLSSGEKPLSCYVFTENKMLAEEIINKISFGGGCINDCLLHFSNPNLPFGGVGLSGIGQYHGQFGFDTFSRKKSVVKSSTKIDLKQAYAPFSNKKFEIFKKIF